MITVYGDRVAPTVLVCHALTGNSRVAEWWPGLVGPGKLFDPANSRVIGIDAVGTTVRDIVRAQRHELDELGVEEIDVVIGGSLGGMQALQWAIDDDRVRHAVVIGAHDRHSAMGIAFNAVQRDAIALDERRGLRLARKIAMLTYKSEALFNLRHDRRRDRNGAPLFDVEGYLERQAELFERHMDPRRYVMLTHAMDSFDVRDAPYGTARLTFVGISSDWLFRPQDVRAACERLVARGYDARYLELESDHGHDAFLAESEKLAELLRRSLSRERGTLREILPCRYTAAIATPSHHES